MAKEVEWPEIDISTIAPLRDGKPDLYNHMPTRFVPLTEAKARGFTFFYMGESCRWGHQAPRYVSNPRMCVDCHRTRDGRLPIGVKGNKEYSGNLKPYSQPQKSAGTAVATVAPSAPRPLEPDALEKKFLTEYAKERDFKRAAENCGRHEAEFLGRLSFDKIFREAVNQLELDNGLCRTLSLNEAFEWTDDKRAVLMRMYINTGDLAQAMKSIGVDNYHYERELEDNPEFRSDMEKAEELALRQMDRHAISKALDGDSRLLQRVMAGNMPDKYGERVKMDVNLTQKLTDDQLNARLAQGLARLEQIGARILLPSSATTVLDGEFEVDGSAGQAETAGDYRDEAPEDGAQSNMDLV
jgi:hypothetical protein